MWHKIVEMLQRCAIFKDLGGSVMLTLTFGCSHSWKKDGDLVFKKGDEGNQFYLQLTGFTGRFFCRLCLQRGGEWGWGGTE